MTVPDRGLGLEELSFVGASSFVDARPDLRETEPRIYVKFFPAGAEAAYLGLLDTGGHYCILAQDIASSIEDDLTESIGHRVIRTSRGLIRGDLHTHSITLIGEIGESLDVEVIVFISPDWQGPNILGYLGVLDRVQFAIQPRTNRIFFGLSG